MAENVGDGMLRWVMPPGYDAMSGRAYLGYAHGAAASPTRYSISSEPRGMSASAWPPRLAVAGWPSSRAADAR